ELTDDLAAGKVPHLRPAKLHCSQDPHSIRAERDANEPARRERLSARGDPELAHWIATGDIPYPHRSVRRCGEDASTVRAERDATNWTVVLELVQQLAAAGVPHPSSPIRGAADDVRAVGAERNAVDRIGMSRKNALQAADLRRACELRLQTRH